jgi:hypothetical protein
LGVTVLALSAGCQLEKMFPEEVGQGVGRLSVRNSGVLMKMITADENCGLASPHAIANMELTGEIGGPGTLTLRTENCALDYGELHVVSESCSGVTLSIGGSAVVSATQTVVGTLTGNPDSPIIPAGPDAVTIEVSAELDGFTARFSNLNNQLTWDSGAISYTVRPHLAASASKGVCAIATPNITLEDVQYAPGAQVTVDSGDSIFPVDVNGSRFNAQVGPYQGATNTINGEITVWETSVGLPDPEGDQRLDDTYSEEEYFASFECTEDLALPVSYECFDPKPDLAQGASALTVSAFGNIAALVEAQCFTGATATVTGEVGREGGTARYEVDCVVDLGDGQGLGPSCTGAETIMAGRVRVQGTKVLSGFNTGDPVEPIVPLNRNPAIITLDIAIEAPLRVSDNRSTNAITFESGSLSGTMRPMTAIDTTTGVCSYPTSHVAFENIAVTGAPALLESDGMTFRLHLDEGLFSAQNGKKGTTENFLAGHLTVDGERFEIPVKGDPILNPDYDAASFNAEFMCDPTVALAPSDQSCSTAFYTMLGENAGRLVVQTVGTVAGLINTDGDCGFDSTLGQLQPDEVVGEVGEQGSMSWSVEQCQLGADSLSVYSQDCMGATTYLDGMATIDAARTVYGERETAFFLFDSIRPDHRDAVHVDLTNVDLYEFVTYTAPAGGGEPPGVMTIHEGTLRGYVVPILGERASDPGMYDVTTPVARMSDVELDAAVVTLESAGKTFSLTLDEVRVSAANGIYQGQGNTIQGSMRVNGVAVDFGPVVLNPDFSQPSFDQSYVCTEDLAGLVPPN